MDNKEQLPLTPARVQSQEIAAKQEAEDKEEQANKALFNDPLRIGTVMPIVAKVASEKLRAIIEGFRGDTIDPVRELGDDGNGMVYQRMTTAFLSVQVLGIPTEQTVIDFTNQLNELAEDGTIEYGCLAPVGVLQLATITAQQRYLIIFYPYTTKSLFELQQRTPLAQQEGVLSEYTVRGADMTGAHFSLEEIKRLPAGKSDMDLLLLRKQIGSLKEGQHADEIHPRGGTWLQERANWEGEVAYLRSQIGYLEKLIKDAVAQTTEVVTDGQEAK